MQTKEGGEVQVLCKNQYVIDGWPQSFVQNKIFILEMILTDKFQLDKWDNWLKIRYGSIK